MNRVIKFRGKEFSKNNWIFASAYDQENEIFIIDFANVAVVDETVGQFTGFKDIDDKEIFEGDFIQNEVNPFEIYEVAMVNGCWSAEDKVDCGVLHWFLDNAPFKVIGNIHDNPELLEGGKADD